MMQRQTKRDITAWVCYALILYGIVGLVYLAFTGH